MIDVADVHKLGECLGCFRIFHPRDEWDRVHYFDFAGQRVLHELFRGVR